ncbi:hypothetical protein EDB19DRAFT_1630413, partial [Suillus lakei]
VSHSIAIFSTIFRLTYRGWMHRLWWEDAWAAFALVGDVVCLACIWLDRRITCEYSTLHSYTYCIHNVTFLTHWYRAARMSVIFSIIRITNHSGLKMHKQITYLIAVSFACMWAALLTHRLTLCAFYSCRMGKSVALSLLITDVVADISLVAVPLHLWRNVGLSRGRKILILSAFSASLLITAITIPHSIVLLKVHNIGATSVILAHVKTALSLVICNLLVIVTFVYRVYWKETFDVDQPVTSCGVFTSVILSQMPCSTDTRTLLISEEGTIETDTMKAKMEDPRIVHVEEGALALSTEG